MARGKNKNRGRFNNKGNRDDSQRRERSYAPIVKENEKLENYYNALLNLPDEERATFWEALRRELPNSFRFCGSKGHALAVRDLLESRYIPDIVKIQYEGKNVDPPLPIEWYPDSLAWWMSTPKHVVRRFPPFSAFQKFLVSETSVGNITRQEAVSMIPPLLIDLRPGMTVLDMCAAPGSKSSQLCEMVHRGEEARIRKVLRSQREEDGISQAPQNGPEQDEEADLSLDPSDDGRATGLLIANDADYKRCHMLVHQLKRLSSANTIVTNHDATSFPPIKLPPDPARPNQIKYLKFDRILADVPCTGDGTMRKNQELWKNWVPGNALGLHTTQTRILVRALQLLKAGGRVVYSTCSMNPVENEAVVAAAIERCGGSANIKILDCSDKLPALKRMPGMRSWSVVDRSGNMWKSWEQVEEMLTDDEMITKSRLVETMFPAAQGSEQLPLENCMRVYAHLQDTGAFFITVLEKVREFKAKPEGKIRKATHSREADATPADTSEDVSAELPSTGPTVGDLDVEGVEDAETIQNNKRPRDDAEDDATLVDEAKRRKVGEGDVGKPEDGHEEEPKTNGHSGEETSRAAPESAPAPAAVTEPKTTVASEKLERRDTSIRYEDPFRYLPADHETIREICSFYHLSSRFPLDRFMIRNASGNPAKAIYYTSALAREVLKANDGKGVKFIHAGVKMFMKQDVPRPDICRWRIQAEGVSTLDGYVGEPRVVRLHNKETLRHLLIQMFPKFTDGEWRNLGEIGERARDMPMGCFVLRIEPDGSDPAFREPIALPLWKSFKSLNLMLPKEDRAAMLLRVFNDTTPLVNNGLERQKERELDQEKEREREREDALENAASPEEHAPSETLPAETTENARSDADTKTANGTDAENDMVVDTSVEN